MASLPSRGPLSPPKVRRLTAEFQSVPDRTGASGRLKETPLGLGCCSPLYCAEERRLIGEGALKGCGHF